MEIALTWNLVLLSGFLLLFSYNFLLGQNGTIKLILSTYIAILSADGVAGLVKRFFFDTSPGFQQIIGEHEVSFFAWVRICFFLVFVLVFVIKSGFNIIMDKHHHWLVRLGIHAIFSMFSALLFLSTILIYISGNSFVEGMVYASEVDVYQQSLIAKILIDYYQIWFSFPAMAWVISSFMFDPKNKE